MPYVNIALLEGMQDKNCGRVSYRFDVTHITVSHEGTESDMCIVALFMGSPNPVKHL